MEVQDDEMLYRIACSTHEAAREDPSLMYATWAACAATIVSGDLRRVTPGLLAPLRLIGPDRDTAASSVDALDAALLSASQEVERAMVPAKAQVLFPFYLEAADHLLGRDEPGVLVALGDAAVVSWGNEDVEGAVVGGQAELAEAVAAYRAGRRSLVDVCSAADSLWRGFELAELAEAAGGR